MANLQDLYFGQLKDLYDAEHQLVEALPKLAGEASSPELRKALETHLQETREQVERLEQIFQRHGVPAERETCKAMKGLISEGDSEMREWDEDSVKDAAMIASAQRVEHYEIAGYGSARAFAQILGFDEDIPILERTIEEEKNADRILSDIAVGGLNQDALLADEADESDESNEEESPSPNETRI